MIWDTLYIYVIIQRRVQERLWGSSPSWISEIYAFLGGRGGVWPLPSHKKKKKCKPFLGEKKPEYVSLNIFKTMSSSQPLLNLAKYKSKDKEIYFKDLHFRYHKLCIPCFTDYACRHYCAV